MRIKRVAGLLLMLALCLSLAGVTALAEAEPAEYEPIDLDKAMSLAVAAYADDHAFAGDIAGAQVVVDVYRLADAVIQTGYDAYEFVVTEAFADVIDLEAMDTTEAQAAQAVAAMHAALEGEAEPVLTLAYGAEPEKVDPGLYLLVPHGEDIEDYVSGDVTIAQSAVYGYSFEPQLVSVPTRVSEDGSVVMTSDSGAWVYDIAVTLKAERAERFGGLIIRKTVDGFDGQPATFVFSIEGEGYSNVASIYYTGGSGAYTEVTMIPAGIEVTVEEIYEGARYRCLTEPQTVTIVADAAVTAENPEASVDFMNEYTGGHGGSGIENKFSYDAASGGWVLEQTPAKGQ